MTSFGTQSAITIGKFRLIAELGHGGMSDVFLAVSKGMGGFRKLLVIKQLRPNLAEDDEFLAMFLDEARLAARLNHRNVVATYEVGEDAGRYYIAMEYLAGQALKRVLQRAKERFDFAFHLRVISEVLKGLHHAHELCDYDGTPLGVVHRDVSPHNIFVTYAGDVKLVDFGVAKALDSSTETSAGVMKGKLAYMSPEQARGLNVDRRADIFSVGVLLWEGLTGKRMWAGETSSRIAERLVGGQIPRVREKAPDAPGKLVDICERALACDLDRRYATALEMHDEITSYVEACELRRSSEDLGRRVEKLFADERLLMQTIIERQLSRIRASQDSEEETVGVVTLGPITTGSRTPTSGSERRPDPSHTGAGMVAGGKTPDRGVSAVWKGGLIAALATAAAAIAASELGQDDTEAVASGEAVVASVHAKPSAHPLRSTIRLRISVQPPDARLSLDGVRLPSNPFEKSMGKDATLHRVRAEAPGFASQTREVRLDSDVLIVFALAPLQDSSATASVMSSKVETALPGAATSLPGVPEAEPSSEPTKRPIDSRDPWSP